MTAAKGEARHLAVYDGRDLVGSVDGCGRDWCAFDARGNAVTGAPFKSHRKAIAALNAARTHPCGADARLDNS